MSLGVFITPALSHHSFAMYDQTKTVTWTGVMTRFVSQANHAEIHFVPLGPDGKPMRGPEGKPITWGVEMAGAAAVAQQGITVGGIPGRARSSASGSIRCGTAVISDPGSARSPSARRTRSPLPASIAIPSRAATILGGTTF